MLEKSVMIAGKSLQILIVVVSLVSLISPRVEAQESAAQHQKDLADAQRHVQDYVDAIRPKLFADLSPPEARIYKSIEFRVTDKDEASSALSSYDERRVIEIGVGYGRQIEMMAEAVIIEGAQHRPVLIPYARYVAKQWSGKASFTKDPTAFAHFDVDDLDDMQISSMAVNGMAFVLAHEVAHHVLHHYDKPLPKELVRLRELEEEADAWALNQCVKGHFSPIGGMLPLLLNYYLTANPVMSERGSNHPADARRIKSMFEKMEASLPQYRDDIQKQGQSYEEFRRFVRRQISDYENQISTDSPPVDELIKVQ
jgi:hypothetical protein